MRLLDDKQIRTVALEVLYPHLGERLPYDHGLFFRGIEESDVVDVPLDELIWDHFLLDSVKNAYARMSAAQRGEIDRREPLALSKYDRRSYLILDGNSTAAIAWFSGWPDVPARVNL